MWFVVDRSLYLCIISLQKKTAQKTRSLQQSQTGFEQILHIALDLAPEEEEELKKLRARYNRNCKETIKHSSIIYVCEPQSAPR